MSEDYKEIIDTMAKAIEILPKAKREYLIGYADGVEAMASAKEEKEGKNSEHL